MSLTNTLAHVAILLDAGVTAGDMFLPQLGKDLTLGGTLVFFLYYFMRELKEMRKDMDARTTRYEETTLKFHESSIKREVENRQAIDRLTEALEVLTEKINKP